MLLDLKHLVSKYNLKIKGVLHIGAHWGEENDIYDYLNIPNRIFIEPLLVNYNVLCNRIDNRWRCIRTALGNSIGEIEMLVEEANNGQSSSVLNPKEHLNLYPHIVFNKREIVPITKLDLIDYDREQINFINIDVQGYELEVFKGGGSTLNHIDFINTEVNRGEVYENCARVEDLDLFLSKYRFKRLDTTWDGNLWGDAFYAKTSI